MRSTRCADCHRSTGRRHARYCDGCRWRHRIKPAKWRWTPGALAVMSSRYVGGRRGNATEIARALGFPKWVVTRKAAELGLSKPYQQVEWTTAEEAFLVDHAGVRPLSWIARSLGRPIASVACKAKREQIRVGLREGYTMRELELCFGESHKVIRRWIDAGRLRIETRGYLGRDPLAVTDEALWEFVSRHPNAFDLRRVDQPWFMNLVLSRGRLAGGLEQVAS